ncbi:MAG TPA: 50S ribosomal protein L25/general stress protein Ctc [Micromonosporaceae bacterium]|nr:50S ribosomal protein L25/general stress protein Ctc [Micromonosporaceae bacterium]
MSEVRIKAETRTEFGKGGARRTRRAGNVPAVLYGHGTDPQNIALPAREFAAAIRHGGINQLFTIEGADGTETLALPKAIQRDPVRDSFDHIDLLIVRRGEKVTVDVPVLITGAAAPETIVTVEQQTLSVIADATQLPDRFEVSIQGLQAGSHITAGQVELPEGTELAADPESLIVVIQVAAVADLGEPEVVEGEEAAEVAPVAEAPAEAEES